MSYGYLTPNFGLAAIYRDYDSDRAIASSNAACRLFNIGSKGTAEIYVPKLLYNCPSAHYGFKAYTNEKDPKFSKVELTHIITADDLCEFIAYACGEEPYLGKWSVACFTEGLRCLKVVSELFKLLVECRKYDIEIAYGAQRFLEDFLKCNRIAMMIHDNKNAFKSNKNFEEYAKQFSHV